jgi:hypothetical protein
MTYSLTGDPLTDALIPPAVRLIWAVREQNQAAVAEAIADATEVADLAAFVVVLAAMVPDDQAPTQLLAWMADPDEYLRLRTAGVGAVGATILVKNGAA